MTYSVGDRVVVECADPFEARIVRIKSGAVPLFFVENIDGVDCGGWSSSWLRRVSEQHHPNKTRRINDDQVSISRVRLGRFCNLLEAAEAVCQFKTESSISAMADALEAMR